MCVLLFNMSDCCSHTGHESSPYSCCPNVKLCAWCYLSIHLSLCQLLRWRDCHRCKAMGSASGFSLRSLQLPQVLLALPLLLRPLLLP